MRAKVLRTFRDAKTGELYGKGRVVDLPSRRVSEIAKANPSLLHPLEEERKPRKEEKEERVDEAAEDSAEDE